MAMKTGRLILTILLSISIAFAVLILMGYVFIKAMDHGTEDHAWGLYWAYLAIFGGGALVLLIHEMSNETACHHAVKDMKMRIKNLADKLEVNGQDYTRKYKQELQETPHDKAYGLHYVYKTKYLALRQIYSMQIDQLLEQEWATARKPYRLRDWGWKLFIALAVVSLLVSCSYTAGTGSKLLAENQKAADMSIRSWTAKDVSLPHLKDSTCYVFNPENVVSENTVNQLNQQLQKMDHELGVESAVFIVHHVKDKDLFRFAQDIFDLYKIGRDDRGLVMVLALDDHLYRTHTGYGLESELTDAECHQLEARYLIPYMKANMPDSAMIHLTAAFYKTLKNNGIPPSSSSPAVIDNKPDDGLLTDLLWYYIIALILCVVTYAVAANYRGWHLRIYAMNMRRTNIFKSEWALLPSFFGGYSSIFSSSGGGSYSSEHSSHSRSSWGGGRSSRGGSYGGGGSGGGGSTSSW